MSVVVGSELVVVFANENDILSFGFGLGYYLADGLPKPHGTDSVLASLHQMHFKFFAASKLL